MSWLDWLLVALPLAIVITAGVMAQRKMRSVAQYLSGGRVAGRYLLAVAKGEMMAGAVIFVALFEVIGRSGFTVLSWWGWLQMMGFMLVAVTGFVGYRFRETRALTLAQFLEIRYSRRFRIFTGGMAFLAGVMNFGIIPIVGARFFVYFLGLPAEFELLGWDVRTEVALMGAFLCVTLFLTMSGGLITVMITDCVEGIMSQLFYIIIIVALLVMFRWEWIATTLADRPAGHSLLNPYDAGSIEDFNLVYMLITVVVSIYGYVAFQSTAGYNAAALTPHEARMGSVLGRWRETGRIAFVMLLGICAITFLHHPQFAGSAAAAHDAISAIEDPQTRSQMTLPIALSHLLPIGIKGLLCVILLMGVFGGDSTHLHSWSSIFVQDVLVPLRRRPLPQHAHIRLLRFAALGVAVFAFLFGCFFRQTEYVQMWFQVTTAFYVGGAGAAIVGGLYWRVGTTAGAWSAVLLGSTTAAGGVIARQIYGQAFPLNGNQISFIAILLAAGCYVIVSRLTHRGDFDLEKMLHRPARGTEKRPAAGNEASWWYRAIGVERDFTRGDKVIAGALFVFVTFWVALLLVVSIWHAFHRWPTGWWITYWHIAGVGVPISIAIGTGLWFTWGGVRDIRALFRRVSEQTGNPLDNGMVLPTVADIAPRSAPSGTATPDSTTGRR